MDIPKLIAVLGFLAACFFFLSYVLDLYRQYQLKVPYYYIDILFVTASFFFLLYSTTILYTQITKISQCNPIIFLT